MFVRVFISFLLSLVLAACQASQATPAAPTAPLPTLPAPSAAPTAQPSAAPAATAAPSPEPSNPPVARPAFSYPIGVAGRPLGDGFIIRHGFGTENTWYNPGYWHTGEDWYAQQGDTAGANVYAIAAGEVVYAGANYPGRVVLVQHSGDLVSMYGHLDPALSVRVGDRVARGRLLGQVLRRGDDVPNHLHFELRTFVTTGAVNGAAPRYAFRCGPDCPPGPGYWPIDAPNLPAALGWRNPVHAIARRMLTAGATGEAIVASQPMSASLTLWSAPPDAAPESLGALALVPGTRYQLLAVWLGPEDSSATSALAYALWYQLALPDGTRAWVAALAASTRDTGSDGRPSGVGFNLLPAVAAP